MICYSTIYMYHSIDGEVVILSNSVEAIIRDTRTFFYAYEVY